jgi:Ca2+-binding RTX toxin-like protein
VFASLPNATGLAGDNFHAAAAAVDANDFILYDASSGALYYDADGSGAASSPLQFATLWSSATAHPNLTATDFVVS